MSLADAAEAAKKDTRRYAKRLLNWFRNQMKDWSWEAPETAQKALEAQLAGV